MTEREPLTRLCLQFEADAGPANAGRLASSLQSAPFSSLVLSASPGLSLTADLARPLVELAQARGIAALISGDAQLARTLKADGVHVPWSADVVKAFSEARGIVGTSYIVGADAGRSRHDAMAMAEAGADYTGFGIPPHVEDRQTASERRLDLVAWWAEIFEVPVMALDVETAEDVASISAAQADFISLKVPGGLATSDVEDLLSAMNAARSRAPGLSFSTM